MPSKKKTATKNNIPSRKEMLEFCERLCDKYSNVGYEHSRVGEIIDEDDPDRLLDFASGVVFALGASCNLIEDWNSLQKFPLDSKPKDCSYCDGKVVIKDTSEDYVVVCTGCEMSGPYKDDKADAVRAWNAIVIPNKEMV